MSLLTEVEKLIKYDIYRDESSEHTDEVIKEWASQLDKDYVLVPREPTKEMIEAMQSEIKNECGFLAGLTYAYRAMLQAKEQSQ